MLLSRAQNTFGMLRHTELCLSSPNVTQEPVVFHVVTGMKKKLEKTLCSREWQVFCSMCDTWKSPACVSCSHLYFISVFYLCNPNAIQPDQQDAGRSSHLPLELIPPLQSGVLCYHSRLWMEKFSCLGFG